MPDYRRRLQDLLRELFQFDAADLDFGIYAVMNRKRDQIEGFIEHDLLDVIRDGLQLQSAAQRHQAETDFVAARQKLIDAAGDALDGDQVKPEYRQLPLYGLPAIKHAVDEYDAVKAVRDEATLSADLEAQTYNDLYRFFARYYDDGDFISQRRYGAENKYAIPYNGEEVTLYWANFDQYYVKTGEYFTDYRFAVEPAIGFERATVHFKLRTASVEQNNVKGEKRFFLLAAPEPVTWDAEGRVLTIGFEYRPLTESEKLRYGTRDQQDKLLAEAEPVILKALRSEGLDDRNPVSRRNRVSELLAERLAQRSGEPGKEKSLLARQLTRYAARNTRDYFIHKDLKAFLTRELDFFLKNEVLRLEDLDFDRLATVQTAAARLKTLRLIAGRIIDFLAQIEDFQRRLWEKRKFVVQSDTCVTLDRVPPELYAEIAANDRQREEWRKLYGLELGLDADLSQHPFAMVDTAFFDADFKARLLASFADLDAACDGLLVHGENFQALRLLTPRYREQVKCIYIDPPYNTGDDDFPYKDDFQHSSWLSMMDDRLRVALSMLDPVGVMIISIGREELFNLEKLCDRVFGDENRVADLVWEKGRKNDAKYFSLGQDYLLVYVRSMETLRTRNTVWREEKPGAKEILAEYRRLRRKLGDDHKAIARDIRLFYSSLPKGHPSLQHRRYNRVDANGIWRDDNMSWPGGGGPSYDVIHPATGKPCKLPEGGWRFATIERFILYLAHGFIEFRQDHSEPPILKRYLNWVDMSWDPDAKQRRYVISGSEDDEEVNVQVMPSVFYKNQQPTVVELSHIMGGKEFNNPKDPEVLGRLFRYVSPEDTCVVDFFAGSGTTGHAVIELNREDKGSRKFVLVEMADHFDTVLKPRIQKVAYAADWRDGKPVAGSAGQSHMFQYIRLESYEDSLNNVRFRELSGPLLATLDKLPDYTLRYMLDFETQGSPSLLDPAQFERPFDYTLEITRDGVTQPRAVDLVATFNFLLGLRVRRETRFLAENGSLGPVVRVTGEDAAGRRVCVLWRDAPPLEEMEAEKAWLLAHVLKDVEYDVLYINGESALAALPIEPEFRRLMFEGVR